MAEMILRPALQYSQGRSSDWSGAELVNCFAEMADGDKRADFAVLLTPGLTLFSTVGAGPIRGMIMLAGVLYVVSGGSLYSVDENGTATLIGTVGGSDLVRMATNYTELCIAANGTGYVYSGGLLQTPLSYDVSDVTYIDGYIVWTVLDAEQAFLSGLDDALTYDPADIFSVEGAPDNVVGMVNDHRELYFMGQTTTEIYYDSGDADNPLQRQGSAFIEQGCFDRDSIAKIDNTVVFVGQDRIVYRLAGYSPQRISTHAIEYHLRDATYAQGFVYTLEGHKFYCLDTDDGTFVFDHATGAWHKRQSFDMGHWRVWQSIPAFGKVLMGDRETGAVYEADNDVLTENGDPIAMDISLPTIEGGRERKTMYAFEVTMETGTGNADAPEPQAMLRYSDDGGHNWSNEMWRSCGPVGAHRIRLIWRKLGQFRQRQMNFRLTDPVRRIVMNWWADIQ